MENMNASVSISSEDDIMRKWTAAELGVKPVCCPVCGKEKTWRKGNIMGAIIKVPIMCQCEVDLEEEVKRQEEAKAKQERLNRILALSNLGERFRDASFDSFKVHDGIGSDKKVSPHWQHKKHDIKLLSIFRCLGNDIC